MLNIETIVSTLTEFSVGLYFFFFFTKMKVKCIEKNVRVAHFLRGYDQSKGEDI